MLMCLHGILKNVVFVGQSQRGLRLEKRIINDVMSFMISCSSRSNITCLAMQSRGWLYMLNYFESIMPWLRGQCPIHKVT